MQQVQKGVEKLEQSLEAGLEKSRQELAAGLEKSRQETNSQFVALTAELKGWAASLNDMKTSVHSIDKRVLVLEVKQDANERSESKM